MDRRVLYWLLGLVFAAIAAVAVWWTAGRAPVADPPVVGDLSQTDPAVVKLIQRTVKAASQSLRDPAAWFTLANVYDANELDTQALICYEQARALGMKSAESCYYRGIVRGRLGQLEEAAADMRTTMALAPSYAPAQWRLGLFLFDLGRLDEAETAFREAMRVDQLDPGGWIGLARVQLERGQHHAAAEALEKLLSFASTNQGYAWQLLALAYRGLGRGEEAELAGLRGQGAIPVWNDPWLARLQQFCPSRKARLAQGKQLLDDNRVADAITHLTSLYKDWPEEPGVGTNLGMALGRAALDDSIRVLNEVVAAHPTYAPAQLNLAVSLHGRSLDKGVTGGEALRAQAMTHIDQALRLNPGLGMAHALRATLLQIGGRGDEALAEFEEAARCDPTRVDWLFAAAKMQFQLQHFAEAARDFGLVTRRAPGVPDGHYGLGMALLKLGRATEAEAALQEAAQLKPQDPAIQAALTEARAARAAGPQVLPGG